jgi:hypothetical protein
MNLFRNQFCTIKSCPRICEGHHASLSKIKSRSEKISELFVMLYQRIKAAHFHDARHVKLRTRAKAEIGESILLTSARCRYACALGVRNSFTWCSWRIHIMFVIVWYALRSHVCPLPLHSPGLEQDP